LDKFEIEKRLQRFHRSSEEAWVGVMVIFKAPVFVLKSKVPFWCTLYNRYGTKCHRVTCTQKQTSNSLVYCTTSETNKHPTGCERCFWALMFASRSYCSTPEQDFYQARWTFIRIFHGNLS